MYRENMMDELWHLIYEKLEKCSGYIDTGRDELYLEKIKYSFMKMNRVFLKLSGEALAGEKKTGFDEETVKEVARQVKLAVDAGIEVGVVIGGGNFWRGRTSAPSTVPRRTRSEC